MTPITIHTTWTLKPETESSFLVLLKSLREHSVAEPECIYFNVFVNLNKANSLKVVEIYNAESEWLLNVSNHETCSFIYFFSRYRFFFILFSGWVLKEIESGTYREGVLSVIFAGCETVNIGANPPRNHGRY
jgi:hypothetical protein